MARRTLRCRCLRLHLSLMVNEVLSQDVCLQYSGWLVLRRGADVSEGWATRTRSANSASDSLSHHSFSGRGGPRSSAKSSTASGQWALAD